MGITTDVLGPNSVRYTLTSDVSKDVIANQIKTFLSAHGWVCCHTLLEVSSNSMCYESVNSDGTSKKYIRIYTSGGSIYFYVGTSYIDASRTLENTSGTSFTCSGSSAIVISATNKHCAIWVRGEGSAYVGWASCQEMTSVYAEDTAVNFSQFSFIIGANFISSGQFLCPITKWNLGSSYTRCLIPLGSWGPGFGLNSVLGYDINPFTNGNQAFDVNGIVDVLEDKVYHKGIFYALKVLNYGIGITGDKVKIKTNAGYFIDTASGTNKDFIIFSINNGARIVFPA